MVVLDVDGVLTDGGVYIGDGGEAFKRFHIRDGMGIRLLREAGLPVGLITARSSELLKVRARELKIAFLDQGVSDKWAALQRRLAERELTPEACAFMGDDLVDLPILTRVGFAAAPADADPETASRVHWIAPAGGGSGAVRALAEGLLRAQGLYQATAAQVSGVAWPMTEGGG